jgi:hypothetical protein
MVYTPCVFGKVFIHDGKCWAAYCVRNFKAIADGFDEGGFSGTHFTMKSKNPLILMVFYQLCGNRLEFIR